MRWLLIFLLCMPLVTAGSLAEYPNFFSGEVIIAVGDLAIASDTVGAIEIATSLQAETDITVTAALSSEVMRAGDQDLIVVGGPCANGLAAELLGYPLPCYGTISPNTGVIQLFSYDHAEVILVAGNSALDTRRASRILSHYAVQPLGDTTKLKVTRTLERSITVN